MERRSVIWGAGLLFVAVGCGAFGAHGLKALLDAQQLAQWHTAVEYQFYHGLGLLLLAGLSSRIPQRTVCAIRWLFILGVVFFCGSIYLLSTRPLLGLDNASSVLGPMTPLGGLFFMSGWCLLFLAGLRRTDEN